MLIVNNNIISACGSKHLLYTISVGQDGQLYL